MLKYVLGSVWVRFTSRACGFNVVVKFVLRGYCFVLLKTESYIVAFVFACVVAVELLWCPCR